MTDAGIYVATLTPFIEGKLNLAAVRHHVEFLIEADVAGICPAGTTGEFLYLSAEEKKNLFDAVIEACGNRAKVFCCTWDSNADSMAELCKFVSDKGADAIFLPPPIYYSFTDDEIVEFYEFARQKSGVPVYCYNIPKYTNNEISMDALATMVERKTITGIKDSSADPKRIAEIISRFGDSIEVLAGGDHFVKSARDLGADGFISALANVYPEPFVDLWGSPNQEGQQKIDGLRNAVKGYGGIPALKYLLSKRGFDFGCRFPFKDLSDEEKRALDGILDLGAAQG